MKKLSLFFNAVVGMIVVAFIMSVATAVREHQKASEPQPRTIPTPALGQ